MNTKEENNRKTQQRGKKPERKSELYHGLYYSSFSLGISMLRSEQCCEAIPLHSSNLNITATRLFKIKDFGKF